MKRISFLLFTILTGLSTYSNAQGISLFASPTDPAYLTDLSSQLTLRTFVSRKIIGYQVGKQGQTHEAEYSPNDVTSIGVGFTYKALGLNVNFRIPGLNNDDDKYGKTKSLDLASYLYLRKFTIDAFAQIYEGHFLSDNDFVSARLSDKPYLVRPDLKTSFFGLNAHYIFNHTRFSYRAPFLQNEWQRQSAGSFLAGVNLHYTGASADSTIIPGITNPLAPEVTPESFSGTKTFSIGIDGGYAHTFVLKEHWFLTLAVMAGVGGNRTTLEYDYAGRDMSTFGLHLNGTGRAAVGYNSENWFFGAYYVNFLNRNFVPISSEALWLQSANGLYRIVIAKRFAFREGRSSK